MLAERCWDEALEGETNGACDAGGDFLGCRVGMGRLRRNRADARRIRPLGALQTGFRRVDRPIATAARAVDFPRAVSRRRAAPGGGYGRDSDGLYRLRSDCLDRAEDSG